MRGSSRSKLLGVGVVAGTLLAAPSAHAALAGAPYLDTLDRPDLQSVNVVLDNVLLPNRAEYCFDTTLRNTVSDHGFQLRGYSSSSSITSTNAVLDLDHPNCAQVDFPLGSDIPQYTVGSVSAGAVRSLTGSKDNLRDATGLGNSRQSTVAGATVGPNITSVVSDASQNELVVTYDQRLFPFVPNNQFFYYDAIGNKVYGIGGSITDVGETTVARIQFPTSGGTKSVRDAVRFGVNAGAVTDRAGQDNIPASANIRQTINGVTFMTDGETGLPDLVNASISGPTSLDLTFDEPIKSVDASAMRLYNGTTAGTPIVGGAATVLNSNSRVVRVFFGAASEDTIRNGQVVAVALDDAVQGTDFPSLASSQGAIAVGSLPAHSAYTSAPDATGVTFNKEDGTATVTFDQELGDVPNANDCNYVQLQICVDNFRLRDRFGNTLGGAPSFVAFGEDDSRKVVLVFGSDQVENAVGIDLAPGAVYGQNGDASVAQLVGLALSPATPNPPVTPVPPVVQPPTPATPTPPAAGGGSGGTAAAASPSVAGSGSVINVSPATTTASSKKFTITLAKVQRVGGRSVVRVRVNGKGSAVLLRFAVLNAKGKTVRTLTKTVSTNRIVTVPSVKVAKGQRIRVTLG